MGRIRSVVYIKNKKTYEFSNLVLAKNNKLLPPELYLLSIGERQMKLTKEYFGYGFGAWAMCINHWAGVLINANNYPEIYTGQ